MTNKFAQGLVAIAATLLMASTASAVNLLANPGFENPSTAPGVEYFGAPGWTDFGAAFTINNLVVGPAGPHGGTQALKVFGNTSGVFQQFAASAGQQWDGGAWALNDTNDQMANSQLAAVNIEWISAANTNIGTVFGPNITAATPTNVWQNLLVSGIAPAGTAFARLVLITGDFNGTTGPGGAPRFDDASFSVVPVPAAVWLFGSALGLMGLARRKSIA